MRLHELLACVPGVTVSGSGDPEIAAIVFDSRKAVPGALFAALPGVKADGARFAAGALHSPAVVTREPSASMPRHIAPTFVAYRVPLIKDPFVAAAWGGGPKERIPCHENAESKS